MTASQKPTSPLFGWVAAGADLLSAQVEQVTGVVSKQIDATHALFEDLQQRGEAVDSQLRQTLNPSTVFSSLQNMMMAKPLISLLPGAKKAAVREQQLEVLTAKVDLLVEQVALLAAKRAAEKQATKAASKPASRSTSKVAATKKAATEDKDAAKTTAAKKPATTRRRTSAATKTSKTAASSGTASGGKTTVRKTTRRSSTSTKSE
ncbi:hypothetical protein [Alteromonas sp. CYL-A6]|uniref:hypothetical protein n=1 Tax=Alteromonas nitratireducens TaxID=3390813 RepID=UPI0034C05169